MPALNTTFKPSVNVACINALFSGGKIKPMVAAAMHEQTARIYEAVRVRMHGQARPAATTVARELNISPQVLHNWESRGPSHQGLLAMQAHSGVNATWVMSGQGGMFIAGHTVSEPAARYSPTWPFRFIDYSRIAALSADERTMLEGVWLHAAQALGFALGKPPTT